MRQRLALLVVTGLAAFAASSAPAFAATATMPDCTGLTGAACVSAMSAVGFPIDRFGVVLADNVALGLPADPSVGPGDVMTCAAGTGPQAYYCSNLAGLSPGMPLVVDGNSGMPVIPGAQEDLAASVTIYENAPPLTVALPDCTSLLSGPCLSLLSASDFSAVSVARSNDWGMTLSGFVNADEVYNLSDPTWSQGLCTVADSALVYDVSIGACLTPGTSIDPTDSLDVLATPTDIVSAPTNATCAGEDVAVCQSTWTVAGFTDITVLCPVTAPTTWSLWGACPGTPDPTNSIVGTFDQDLPNGTPISSGMELGADDVIYLDDPPTVVPATYPISPVTASLVSELGSDLPIILGVIGALIVLTVAVRADRKFAKV
jgi:hypothetical protein